MKLPASHTPRCRHTGASTRPTPPIVSIAGKVPNPKASMTRTPEQRSGRARGLGGEGIDQRTWQEAVEHAKGDRGGGAFRLLQTAQRHGERVAAKADRHAMKALEQTEKLESHGDHQEPGGDRQKSLRGVERTAQDRDLQPLRGAPHLAQRAGERAEEAIGRQPAGIVEEVTPDGRGVPSWIASERTGKATAHADAMEAAGEPAANITR